jgi:hypothetical protein
MGVTTMAKVAFLLASGFEDSEMKNGSVRKG